MDPLRRAIGLQRLSLLITGMGFVGLGVTAAIRTGFGLRKEEFMASLAGSAAVFTFAVLFVVGLVVLFPVSVFMQRKAVGPVKRQRIPWWGWFFIPLGLGDPNWEVPPWIAWPVLALFFAVLAVFFLIVAGLVLTFFFGSG